MAAAAPRRSPRLKKNVHMVHDEDSDEDSLPLKRVKLEVTDLEETISPSTSPADVASVSDEDGEQGFDSICLKDLRARCKAKNRKASRITPDRPDDIRNQYQVQDIEDEKPKVEFDLDEPLIALKQKRKKTSPSKANKKLDVLTSSPCAVKVEVDAATEINQDPTLGQISIDEAVMHDSVPDKLEGSPTELEHSDIASDCTEERVGVEDCGAEAENPVEHSVNCENSDIQDICSEEAGTFCHVTPSSPNRSCVEHSSVDLQQMPKEDDQHRPQPCFTDQTIQSAHGIDNSCELMSSTEACNVDDVAEKAEIVVSSVDLIDEVTGHQKSLEDTANSDTDTYSMADGFSVCFVNKSCDDYLYDDEYWNTESEKREPESVTVLEELSPINGSNVDMMSPLVAGESDFCGSKDRKCSALEEVVQIQRSSQLDTGVCCNGRPNQILEDREIKHATTEYAFDFDKSHDVGLPTNFVAQDGRLESIVYEALNNHTQVTSEKTSAVVQCPVSIDNCHGDEISLPNAAEQSLKMDILSSRIDYSICKSVGDERLGEVQTQLLETCVLKETASQVPSEISIAEDTQEMLAGSPDLSSTSLETENRNVEPNIFINEESIEEYGPKKLFTKRKIMSPSSQEKLCNALTGIDLCGVKRLKNDINHEDGDKSGGLLPQPAHNREQSALNPARRLRVRTSFSPTSKGGPKSIETSSHQEATCSCKGTSPVVLDTEKAVEFSQRQMHDIENIAAKLIKSLKHMKSIVDETLSSEAYSVVPNFNVAEIRAASEDALEVEKTTKKWLSIMNKDCTRFCKILTLAKKKDVSVHEAPRKQRKIMFADEAGGKLCHVKVIKDRYSAQLSECE